MLTSSRFRFAGVWLGVAVATILILAGSHAFGCPVKAGSVTIDTPWSRATPAGAKIAAGYFKIKNEGDSEDRLVSASTNIAGRTEIHQTSMEDGVTKMRPVPGGVAVPAHASAAFEPNSYHLMFTDLNQQLKKGETFTVTLKFEKAGPVEVTFNVEGIGASAPEGGGHDHHSSHH